MPLPPHQALDPANAHLSGHICAICDGDIAKGETYYAAALPPKIAAQVLEVDDPRLVPAWRQLPDGRVRLSLCWECRADVTEPDALAVLVEAMA